MQNEQQPQNAPAVQAMATEQNSIAELSSEVSSALEQLADERSRREKHEEQLRRAQEETQETGLSRVATKTKRSLASNRSFDEGDRRIVHKYGNSCGT